MASQTGETESGAQGKLKAGNQHVRVFNWRLTSSSMSKSDMNAESGGVNTMAPVGRQYSLKFQVYVSTGFQPDESALTSVGLLEGSTAYLSLRVGSLKCYGNGTNTWLFRILDIDLVGCDPNGFSIYDVSANGQEAKPALGTWVD
jgi:hypothetical protein